MTGIPSTSRPSIGSRRRILDLLLTREPLSRAELARLTNLNKPTVSNLVARLIDEGIVHEIGSGTSTGGRKPILLTIRGASRFVAGVEIDASGCRLILVDLHGERVALTDVTLGATGLDLTVDAIAAGLDTLLGARDRSALLGCGVAVPGLVDPATETVDSVSRLGWSGVPLRSILAGRIGVPVSVTDRGKAAGLGELWTLGVLGKERARDLIYLYLGRGVAGAIVLDREIHWGSTNIAGEIGHITVDPDGPPCACGNLGCLEALVSTTSIIHHGHRLFPPEGEDPLTRVLHSDAPAPDKVAALGHAATAGDARAIDVVTVTARWLGIAIAGLINTLNPSVVVLGGPTSEWGQVLSDAVDRELARRALPQSRRAARVVIGHARDLAAPLGAAALMLQQAAGLLAGSTRVDNRERPAA